MIEREAVYLDEAQRNYFREKLLALRDTLKSQINQSATEMKKKCFVLADDYDRATEEEAFSQELRAQKRAVQLSIKIDEALLLFNDDAYGYCLMCGHEIGLQRLEISPTATLCVGCKTAKELKEKKGIFIE